ncbi:MAG TPA: hypothetical protein VJ739_17640, partial [Gemmataceae bacterium]|nr:hypothetical protein [Gemmataceae bacterium]
MRTTLPALAVALGLCLAPGPSQAGLYNPADPVPYPPPQTFQQFRLELSELRSIPNDQKTSPTRARVLQRVAALEAKEQAAGLSVEDRVNLAECYVRLLKGEEAVHVLAPAEAQDPGNFLVLANLATANYLVGSGTANPGEKLARLQQAVQYQRRVLQAWPRVWAGFTTEELAWFRRAERYYLRLLEQRWQEARLQEPRAAEGLDPLFPGLRFVGPSGEYEAGELAPEEADALPVERVPLVSQLCLWLPFDNRLYWLLGELLNAQGNIADAGTVMMELEDARGFHNRELHRHRQVVLEARQAAELLASDRGPVVKEQLLWLLAPRGATAAPGAGGLASEAAWAAAL